MMEKSTLHQTALTLERFVAKEVPCSLEEATESELHRKALIGTVTTSVLSFLSGEFVDKGFEWLLPVVFSQSTDPLWPDQSASIQQRVEVEIYGKVVRPTASMIVHKLVACSLTHPKLFILSPNVRIERPERSATGRHLYEFTQLDFEQRYATSETIRDLVDAVLCDLMAHLKRHLDDELFYLRAGSELPLFTRPFMVYDQTVLKSEYGPEWEFRVTQEAKEPFWVTNFTREFYDFEDFETGKWDNYDLFLPGIGEVLSGARREFEYEKIIAKMDRGGVRKENYRVLLDMAKKRRLKPTAGAGLGLERIVSWLVGAEHVGEVQLFPRIPGTIHEL